MDFTDYLNKKRALIGSMRFCKSLIRLKEGTIVKRGSYDPFDYL
jgi:hypothetical protein